MALAVAAEHHVVHDVHVAHQTHAQTVLGHEGEADAQLTDLQGGAVAEVDQLTRLGVEVGDLTAVEVLEARDGLQQLALTRARDARDAQDLAAAGGEAHVVQELDPLVAGAGYMGNGQSVARILGLRPCDVQAYLLADHHFGQHILVGLGGIDGTDVLAAAENGHAVGECQDLVELMGDDDDRFPVVPHTAQDREQHLGLLGSQHGGGLVQNQDVGVAVEDLDDLHRLLLRYRHFVDLLVGVHVEPVALGDLLHAGLGLGAGVARLILDAQDDVLGGGEDVDQLEVLVDHTDLMGEGILGGGDDHLTAVHQNGSLVGEIDAGDHVHEGGLTAAVLTENGQDLTVVDLQGDVLVGLDASEAFGNILHFQGDGLAHTAPPMVVFIEKARGSINTKIRNEAEYGDSALFLIRKLKISRSWCSAA